MTNLGETHKFDAAIIDAKLVLPQVQASVPTAHFWWLGDGKEYV